MRIKAIIFDVDGVLIDSVKIIVELYQKTAKKLGLRIPPSQEVIGLLGKPLVEMVKIIWPNTDVKLFDEEYGKYLMDKNLIIPRIDGAVEAVKKLKNSGFKLGIISGKGIFTIKKHLQESGFNIKWFDAIGSAEATKKHKPGPDPIFYVTNKLNVKPQETLYVGDAIYDYECAKNAKVGFVAVTTGCLSREELKKLGVEKIINSVTDLPEFLGVEK